MTSDACYVTRGTANNYVAPLPAQMLPFSKRCKKSKMSRGFVCMVAVSAVFCETLEFPHDFWLPGIRVILKPPFLQMEKCYPGSKLPPGLSNCKLQLDGSMPVLLTGFEPHPFDFFQLLVSSSVNSKECRYAHKSGSDAWPRVLLYYRLLTCADVAPSSSEFSTASSVLSLLINALATEST